jgi:hypothetical protein
MERGLAVSGICGVMCLVAGLALAAEHTFDGTYAGKRVLTKGSASPTCPAEEDVSVTIHGETLRFANGVLKGVIQAFYPSPDGSFGQTYTDAGGAVVHYHGRIVGDAIEADVDEPPCEYHWHLKKD